MELDFRENPVTDPEAKILRGFRILTEFLANPIPYPWSICNQGCQVLGKDGHERYLFGNNLVIRNEQGQVVGAVETITDLTTFLLSN